MDINYLIQLLGNRLNGLTLAKDQAFSSGDLERINTVDAEILEVKNTLSKLNLISSIEQAAAATSFTEAEVVKNGIESSFNPTVLNDATEILLQYDITPYATDPMHELKIQNILEKMGVMDSPEKIENYIKKTSPDSPLSGLMVWNAVQRYEVDARLMLALMELDSRFGTLGIAVRTLNPGNVGNNGVTTRSYSSWDEGVMAVAKWLDRHRIEKEVIDETPVPPPVVEKVEEAPKEETEEPSDEEPVEEVTVEEPVVEIIPAEPETLPEEEIVVPEVEIPEIITEETPVEPDLGLTVVSTNRKRKIT